ncbi:efflux RND transporter permease subunit [Borrelia miyamotoi]|uniref:efflux RND transporter permease subunit n=1 Tax=Borrelia miyamotoi TaxID=47466 RepID=UPI001F07586D|nr:efflux RND transporter permease subunit [Borrelia miyamotoi]
MRFDIVGKKVIGRPIKILILFLLLIIISIYTFSRLKVDLLPVIEENDVIIFTNCVGSSAKEIERKVTSILEGNLASIKNIKKINSVSFKEISNMSVQFYRRTNLDFSFK